MKIIKMTESINDSKDLEVLMAEKKKVEDYLQLLQTKIRSIVYKYDVGKVDYTKKG